MRRLLPLLLLLTLAPPVLAEPPPKGLMWNRSGLPATLPLQIKSRSGTDTVIFLTDPATGRDILAAYIPGGTPFRLLVPPGTYQLHLATGPAAAWQGEAALFGPGTRYLALDPPVAFTAGLDRLQGGLLDLTALDAPAWRPFALCQHLQAIPEPQRLLSEPAPLPGRDTTARPFVAPSPLPFPPLRLDLVTRPCD